MLGLILAAAARASDTRLVGTARRKVTLARENQGWAPRSANPGRDRGGNTGKGGKN